MQQNTVCLLGIQRVGFWAGKSCATRQVPDMHVMSRTPARSRLFHAPVVTGNSAIPNVFFFWFRVKPYPPYALIINPG